MTRRSEDSSVLRDDSRRQLHSLLETDRDLSRALELCAVPLTLTEKLALRLMGDHKVAESAKTWATLKKLGLVVQRDEHEWQLDSAARAHFLARFEETTTSEAKAVHSFLLDYLGSEAYPTPDADHTQLRRAYHTAPSDPHAGARLYWSTYCRIRVASRLAMLPVLAQLAESQAHWLREYAVDIDLYRAAALYFAGPDEVKHRAMEILQSITERGAPIGTLLDATFLLGTLLEQTDRKTAAKTYQQAAELKGKLDAADGEMHVQEHLRLTLAKSFFNLASILSVAGGKEQLLQAEEAYRYGIQIVQAELDQAYEATRLRELIGLLQKQGREKEIKDSTRRIGRIEEPFRQEFLEEARSSDDLAYLGYAISALNHGLGYESQHIEVTVDREGAAQLEGTYTLRAMSMLSRIDTFLEAVPGSESGIHFERVESLVPEFKVRLAQPLPEDPKIRGAERLEVLIDPPMQPSDILRYRWAARADPGTFATTAEQLQKAHFPNEFVAWDIIAPMRQLEIQVTVPTEQTHPPPPTWFEVWRVGTWHARAQAQTAYRAYLESDPSRAQWDVEVRPGNKIRLRLRVNYPWLAMTYVLAWAVPQT